MTQMPARHPHEDIFEDYVFERLAEPESGAFEEHLLVCEPCQDKLTEVEEYIQVMKAATAAYADAPSLHVAQPAKRRDNGLRWNAAAAAILLLTCLSALLSWRSPPGDPKKVDLQAYRGGGDLVFAQAPAGMPLDLTIDLKDVRPAQGYRVEIVDTTGRRVWFGGTPAQVSKGLTAGSYWVRLATDAGEPLREFGLRVR